MTSLTPSLEALARVHLAMSQPTEELEIMQSRAWPLPWKPESPGRRPPNELICGYRAQSARWTRIASWVSPDSIAESPGHGAAEMPPPLLPDVLDVFGFSVERYLLLIQRPRPE